MTGDASSTPDVTALLARCDAEDWSTGEFGWLQTTEIRQLLDSGVPVTGVDSSARDRAIETAAEHLYRRFARHSEARPWARITEVERGEYRQDAAEVLRALAGATPPDVTALLARLDELDAKDRGVTFIDTAEVRALLGGGSGG